MIHPLLFSLLLGHVLGTPLAKIWLSPVGSLSPLRQYHTQDGSGSYQYSFTAPHHAKTETSLNGITQGGYSYIDANGILQTVTYTADDENGFRISASNLPQPPKDDTTQDTPEVATAKRNHLEELQKSRLREQNGMGSENVLSYKIVPPFFSFAQIQREDEGENEEGRRETESGKSPFLLSKSEAQGIKVPIPDPNLLRSTVSPTTSSPTPSQSALLRSETTNTEQNTLPLGKVVSLRSIQRPIALPAPYVFPILPYRLLHSSLHHTQDSLGQYDYTYTGDSSAKTESRSLDGTTRGAYSYIDPNGILQQVHYIADHNGFRVLASNLPEAK